MNNFSLDYLRSFYFVATSNGFTRAAEKLHVQQPVISRAIKLLEGQLGFKLLERQKKQVLLTPEGREVFRLAERIFSSVDQISSFSTERREGFQGDLCFATSDSLSPEIMGPVLQQLILQYPGICPVHHAGPATLLLEPIRSGALEFGVFFNVPDLPSDLEKSKLANVSFEFVILKDMVKDRETLESFIASREQGDSLESRLPLFEKYKAHHKAAKIVAVSSSSMTRKAMVLNGVGTTVLPRFLVKAENKRGQLKSLHESEYVLPLFLVERKSSYRSASKNALIKLIKDAVES
jgi:LysR family hydrogen peroxide-inducible transcriptional activator